MHRAVAWLVLLALALLDTPDAFAQLKWTYANPRPTGNSFLAVAYGAGTFVAVGDKGAVATSTDGVNWTARESRTDAVLTTVIFDGNRFVSAGDDGVLLQSTDGIEWRRLSTVPAGNAAITLGYGNGTYVLLNSPDLLTSNNGVTWTPHNFPPNCFVGGGANIVYAVGRFVAAGECLMSSADGAVWAKHVESNIMSVTYGNNQFVAAGTNGLFERSSDGTNWTVSNGNYGYYRPIVAYGGGRYISIGFTSTHWTSVSTDGATWDHVPIEYVSSGSSIHKEHSDFNAIIYGAGVFVAVGVTGTIAYSRDGIDWRQANDLMPNSLYGIAFGVGKYVAVGDNGTIQSTTNGIDWSETVLPSGDDLLGITYGGGQFVAVGDRGSVLTSADGSAWSPRQSGSVQALRSVVFGSAGYVAVGANGAVLTSPDATTWTARTSGTQRTLRSVAFGVGRYVATGDSGVTIASSDGVTWALVDSGPLGDTQHAVAFGNNQFVIARYQPKYSPDGITWSTVPLNSALANPTVTALGFGGGVFRTKSEAFTSASPTGLANFSLIGPYSTYALRAIAYGDAGFVGVGSQGLRLRATTNGTWSITHPGAPGRDSQIRGIAAGDGLVVAVGIDFASQLNSITSDIALLSNGNAWTPISMEQTNQPSGIAYHAGTFVASTLSGLAVVWNGGQWNANDPGIGSYLSGIEYLNDRFVALGNGQEIASSLDGISWKPHTIGTPHALDAAAYGNGTYVISSSDGIFASSDLATWSTYTDPSSYSYNALAFGNGKFVAAGRAGIALSTDGRQWSKACFLEMQIAKLRFAGGKFVAIGKHAYVSFDGLEWRQAPMHATSFLFDLTYMNGQYFAVGYGGRVMTSTDDLIFSSGYDGTVCPN